MTIALRRIAVALVLTLPLAAAPVLAADPAPAADTDAARIQKLRERIRTDHKALVAENLALTESEAKAFWPVYEKCHDKLEAANRRTNRAILDYVNGESGMTNARATQIAKDMLAADAEETRARKACYDGAAKVLPGRKAARFLQIENKIRALTRFDAAVAIPLVQ